jgi:3-hydroxyisobutyrate dehydrogenase-like beta-hydroxyacid dehydrogenase
MRIGIVHPGAMGAAVGGVLAGAGHTVYWASEGRSEATAARAREHGLADVGTLAAVAERAELVFSICPPHAAREVAAQLAGFGGIFVDANAVSPATARAVGAGVARFVDGGIVGGPPRAPAGETRLYLSGAEAPAVAALFDGTPLEARVVPGEAGAASAMKMAYAAWTKGSAALLLACRGLARAEGVEADLLAEWSQSQPGLAARLPAAAGNAQAKGWRWVGEMEEIAASFAAAGLPDGFHLAAAELYRSFPRGDGDPLERFLATLAQAPDATAPA